MFLLKPVKECAYRIHLLAGEIANQVRFMYAQVRHGPETGFFLVEEPFSARAPIFGTGVAEHGRDMQYFTQDATGYDLACSHMGGEQTLALVDRQESSRLSTGFNHAAGLRHACRHGLFNQHVTARLQG